MKNAITYKNRNIIFSSRIAPNIGDLLSIEVTTNNLRRIAHV